MLQRFDENAYIYKQISAIRTDELNFMIKYDEYVIDKCKHSTNACVQVFHSRYYRDVSPRQMHWMK